MLAAGQRSSPPGGAPDDDEVKDPVRALGDFSGALEQAAQTPPRARAPAHAQAVAQAQAPAGLPPFLNQFLLMQLGIQQVNNVQPGVPPSAGSPSR
jgi:hypothetical protein